MEELSASLSLTPSGAFNKARQIAAMMVKASSITSSDVLTYLRQAEKAAGAGSSLRHRLTRSPDPTGAPNQPKGGRCSKAPREDGSWFRLGTGLQLMQLNKPASTKTENKVCAAKKNKS
jgi:hypothetical protein